MFTHVKRFIKICSEKHEFFKINLVLLVLHWSSKTRNNSLMNDISFVKKKDWEWNPADSHGEKRNTKMTRITWKRLQSWQGS